MLRAIAIFTAGIFILAGADASGKTPACPCNPCPCSPCTCGGGGGSKSKPSTPQKSAPGKNTSTKAPSSKTETAKTTSKHHEGGKGKHHGDSGGAVGVGVGVNVDLGGIGQRRAEPDPFAVGGPPVPQTQERPEKPKPKKTEPELVKTNPFTDVELTGEQAKGDIEPPGPINVSDDASAVPPTVEGTPTDKQQTLTTIENLEKAKTAYKKALTKIRDADPKFKTLAADAGTAEGWKKFSNLVKKLDKQFDQSDEGKKLHADWAKAYEDAIKAGEKVPDDLVPSTSDEIENKKFALTQAQAAVDSERVTYNTWKNSAVVDNPGVKSTQAEIDGLKKKTHFSEEDAKADRDKLKQLEADLENAKKQAAKDWAASDAAKNQMKQVQQAEKELDKAKEAFKPYQGLEKATAEVK